MPVVFSLQRPAGLPKDSAMWPHLTSAEVLVVIGLRAIWMAPNWVLKFLAVVEAVKHSREKPQATNR
jgi:hypothetical protein